MRRRQATRPGRKHSTDGVLWGAVRQMLAWKWSPQEIAVTLKRTFPADPRRHVSHETINSAIYAYPKGELRRELIACLRQGRAKRMPRSRGTDRRGQIPDMLSIHVRPPEIGDRLMPGHWEGDLIKGAGNKSAVAVLLERMSRAAGQDARRQRGIGPGGLHGEAAILVAPLRQTMTYDQGREMSRHAELTAATGVRVYFCDPHSPWQRPSNENTNGLLRQYFPKGTDLARYSREELDAVALALNTRPRKTLGWKTPAEALDDVLRSA